MDTLHLYPGQIWHDNGFIVGDKAGLLNLRKAIDDALANEDGIGAAQVFVTDGEGYHCFVIKTDDMDSLTAPYTDEIAFGNEQGKKHPSNLLPQDIDWEKLDGNFWEK